MLLMSLGQNGRILCQTRKMNVFVKPNEQRRACSNIIMARKRTFRGTRKERLIRSLIHSSTCPLINLSNRPPVNMSSAVNYSVKNLTL